MSLPRTTKGIIFAWMALLGASAVVACLPAGQSRTALADILQCMVPLFANAGLLWNAASPHRRQNTFWMLLAASSTIWLVGQLWWTYAELVARQSAPYPFSGDFVFFLHSVPLMAALALQPHARKKGESLRYGHVDFALLALLWVYLYVRIVLPWKFAMPDAQVYAEKYSQIYLIEQAVFLLGLGWFVLRTRGAWQKVYAHLFGAAFLYTVGYLWMDFEASLGRYHTGGFSDLPLVASFVWLGSAGMIAHRLKPAPEPLVRITRQHVQWHVWLAMGGLISLPVFAVWNFEASNLPDAVRHFRLVITLATIPAGLLLFFFRQSLVDRDRLKLLSNLQQSLENLKRLQTQFVQAEKLASLGELAAGAAHEINNPLTAIMGYSELLSEDASAGERARSLGEKIREQARRTKTLVNNLLSFARQVPVEKQLLDLNTILTSALQLRNLDMRDKNIRIELNNRSVLPAVRGDPNQLLQVFYHLISNAVDAMEENGGVLTVSTRREKGEVLVEFSDTGPGLREPGRIFDPFYTTKPVGKATGLGLSICYGIIQEHGGRISGFNRTEGGCTIRIELPAVLALFPQAQKAAPTPVAAI
ncbi:MAG: sensor histidine kinase [Candidatus Acidiferrales bacterium]